MSRRRTRVIDRLRAAHPGTWRFSNRPEYPVWIHVESGREVAPFCSYVYDDERGGGPPEYRWLDTHKIALHPELELRDEGTNR